MSNARALFLIVVVCVVSAGMVISLLTNFGRVAIPFIPEHADATADTSILRLYSPFDNGTGKIEVIHFYLPDCDCNQQSARHIDSLITQAEQDVSHRIAIPAGAGDIAFSWVRARYPGTDIRETLLNPVSAPSLAIYDKQGQLRYFGPYGTGPACIQPSPDYFPQIIEAIRNGTFNGRLINTGVSGCFCRWPPAKRP
ncbi:MAG: hypothetical protein CSH36_06560 [Thalassolituus sp.]|nr:MAG: hypothetical protein CSH36_06560 [Thalassolituus sp.]